METRANYVMVGAFVVLCFFALVVFALWITGAQYSKEFAYYQSRFTGAVTGLGSGTPVRYNGIDVGRVSKLKFDPDDPKQVIVLMEVDPSLTLHDDSVAYISSSGLTGGAFVEIDGGTKDAPLLQRRPGNDYPEIRSKQSTLQELEMTAPALLAKLNRIADEFGEVIDEHNRQQLGRILDNTDKLTAALADKSDALKSAIDNLDRSSAELTDDLKSLHGTVDRANAAVSSITKLSDDADGLIGGDTAEQLSQLLGETRATVKSLHQLSTSLQSDPSRLLFGDHRKGYKPQ